MNMDRLPFTGFQTTWSLKLGTAPYLPDYDPDSASTGTMWATGQKTVDERISQGPSAALTTPGANLKTVLELAQKQGKRVGNVSTAEITDATPAVLNSHVSQRGCQAPKDMTLCPTETKAAGGLGSIAEQTVDHKVDVVLGGGQGRFNTAGGPIAGGPDDGKTVDASAAGQGYAEEGQGQRVLPAGRGSFDRQAGPRGQRVRADRRGGCVRRPIGVALDYQRTHPDTLIAVTADHSHTSQIVGEDTTGTGNPTGYSDNLITKDNQVQRITYGTAGGETPPTAPPSQQHTGAVVPIWGKGPGAAAVLGTTDHTDLFKVLQGDSGHCW